MSKKDNTNNLEIVDDSSASLKQQATNEDNTAKLSDSSSSKDAANAKKTRRIKIFGVVAGGLCKGLKNSGKIKY